MTPAVVVIAYNRPASLARLLRSIAAASYRPDAEVPLVVSIDRGEQGIDAEVAGVAADFPWQFGPKRVVEREKRLGLVEHFRACGRLSVEYGAVVLLEDDLVVSPAYHSFARQVTDCYADDKRIAGACLYRLWFNGFTQEPFEPVDDGNDAFFLGVPYTQGLVFRAAQWSRFEAHQSTPATLAGRKLHPSFRRFAADEWFPALASYVAAEGKYFAFPRSSLVTGWGDAGSHFETPTSWLQTPLQMGPRDYRLPSFDSALAVYDGFFELGPDKLEALGASLPVADFDVDLNATKRRRNLEHAYVLTTRPVRRAVTAFGLTMQPPEANVVYGVPGDAISLAHRRDVYWDRLAGLEARRRLHAYGSTRYRPSRKRSLMFAVASAVQRFRDRRREGRKT
jgi:hypothetical protein